MHVDGGWRGRAARMRVLALLGLLALSLVVPAAAAPSGTQVPFPNDQTAEETCAHAHRGCQRFVHTQTPPPGGGTFGLEVAVSPGGDKLFADAIAGRSPTTPAYTTVYAVDAGTGTSLWSTDVDPEGPTETLGLEIAVTSDGGTVVAGIEVDDPEAPRSTLAVGLDPETGQEVWRTTLASSGAKVTPRELVSSADGSRVFLALQEGSQAAVVSLDAATGTPAWTATLDLPAAASSISGLIAHPSGASLLVAGKAVDADGDGDAFVANLAATDGNTSWLKQFGVPDGEDERADSLSLGPGGDRVYVNAQLYGPPDRSGPAEGVGPSAHVCELGRHACLPYDLGILALDAGSGSLVWETRFDAGEGYIDAPRGLTVAGQGDVVASGLTFGTGTGWDAVAVGVDAATGQVAWEHNVSTLEEDLPWVLRARPADDRVYLVGETDSIEHGWDRWVRAIATDDGRDLWTARHDIQGDDDLVRDAEVAPDGASVHTIGDSDDPNVDASGPQATLVAFDRSLDGAQGIFPQRPAAEVREERDARASLVAVSRGGDASAGVWCPVFTTCTPAVAIAGEGAARSCTGYQQCAAVTGDGPTQAYWAASVHGDSRGVSAVSGTGDAEGTEAISGTGNSTASFLAASGTGESQGYLAASGLGDARGGFATTVAGNATGDGATSGTRNASGTLWAVTVTGDASARHVAISGTGNASETSILWVSGGEGEVGLLGQSLEEWLGGATGGPR